MHTVIKGTTSIADNKQIRKTMEQLAVEMSERHKTDVENWDYGEIQKVWFDQDGVLCIEYESGNWWHYNKKGEWW